MPVTNIVEIRLLPPLALGRLGSSDEPMDNYDVVPRAAATPASFRLLVPAESLVVDSVTGNVSAVTPAATKFRDASGRIKPVAPFLEVWARFATDGLFEPLTITALSDLGLTPADVKWAVDAANLKVFRRTGVPADRVTASLTSAQLATFARQELRGTAGNFRNGRSILLGSAQYVRPSTVLPEIRFRFTPAPGKVFGHTAGGVISPDRVVYDPVPGTWDNFNDRTSNPDPQTPRAAISTVPSEIYAQPAARGGVNLGYLDDTCDGIVRASITFGGRTLTSIARVSSGPPDFAPDSDPVRSVADDFEQMLKGPDVGTVTADAVIAVVRGAVETMRLMNTETQNRTFPFWVPTAQNAFGDTAKYGAVRRIHERLLTRVQGLTAPAGDPARTAAVATLNSILGMVRDPDKTGDYTITAPDGEKPGMGKMPAFMRGGDGDLLVLTRRQLSILRQAVQQFGTP
jgi:hypothetical protein